MKKHKDTFNPDKYLKELFHLVVNKLNDEEKSNGIN
jgi:hypothetical protein